MKTISQKCHILWIDLVGGYTAIVVDCRLSSTMTGLFAINIWAGAVRTNRDTLVATGAGGTKAVANVGNALKLK